MLDMLSEARRSGLNVNGARVQSKLTSRRCVICQTQRWVTAQLESRGLRCRVSHVLKSNQSMSRKQSEAQISPAQLDMWDVFVRSCVSWLKRAQERNVCWLLRPINKNDDSSLPHRFFKVLCAFRSFHCTINEIKRTLICYYILYFHAIWFIADILHVFFSERE